MEQQNGFSYTYSAPCNQEVLNIRKQYLPQEESKLDKLKKLDKKVRYDAPITFMKEVMIMNNHDQEFLVQKIRTQYTEKQHTELDALKALDAKVKKPANVFAYIYGSLSAIIMGAGMSLVMTDFAQTVNIANPMFYGIVIGIVGLGMALTTYPIHKGILNRRKKKYAAQILALSEKIMK